MASSTDFFVASGAVTAAIADSGADFAAIVISDRSTGYRLASTSSLHNSMLPEFSSEALAEIGDTFTETEWVTSPETRFSPGHPLTLFRALVLIPFQANVSAGGLVVASLSSASVLDSLFADAGVVAASIGAALKRLKDTPIPIPDHISGEWTFHRIFDVSPLLLGITDVATGRFLEANETFVTVSGFPREELLGRTPVELGLWVKPEKREQGLRELRSGELIRSREMEFRVRDGSIRTCLLSAAIVESQGIPAVLSALVDVTERKQAESARRRYQLLADYSRDILIFLDATGRIIEANVGAYATYGYSSEELLSMHVEDLRAAVGPSNPPVPFSSVLEEGARFESVHRRRNGTTFPVEIVAQPAELMGERLVLSVIRDVTDRATTEAALRNSEQHFRALAESLPQMVWTCNATGECDYLSRQWIKYTGVPEDRQLGYRWLEQVHPEDTSKLVTAWTDSVAAGTAFDCEFRICRSDGLYRWFKSRAVPVRESQDHVVRWFGSSTDIDDLKQVDVRRRELIDVLAHDLKNPLAAMKAQAQLLSRRALRGTPVTADQLDVISATATRMTDLIGEMIDASRLSAGQDLELDLDQLDLVELIQSCASSYRDTTTLHRFAVETSVTQLHGTWDRGRLERVFGNLFSNAIKYSPDGGTIHIGCARTMHEDHEWGTVTIRDEGIGIPQNDLPFIFERNRRAANVGHIRGNGLGLAGAADVVRLHGGSIAVMSSVGRGSIFTVRLPIAESPDVDLSRSG